MGSGECGPLPAVAYDFLVTILVTLLLLSWVNKELKRYSYALTIL